MTEYVHLIGVEQVERAGIAMRNAADDMTRAAANIQGAIEQLSRLVERFEAAARNLGDSIDAANPKL